jgi:hypothetical protein
MDGIVGFVIVLISFFTLPFRFVGGVWRELSEIGRRKSVVLEGSEELPLLNWLLVLGRSLVAITAILSYLLIVIAGASDGGSSMVLAIIFGPLLSMAIIWFYGVILEFVSLQIVVARNSRSILETLRRESHE